MPLDPNRSFVPVRIAILTVSDTRNFDTDRSGQTLQDRAEAAGHVVAARKIVKDEAPDIEAALRTWVADPMIDAVIATGGTGVTGRDTTPEAFVKVIEKELPGFGEAFRWLGWQKLGSSAIHSRAMAGVADGTWLFAIPGSTGACKDAWDGIFAEQFDARWRPCNFIEMMPRLRE
jgi:molybdopterin adenylyltransferase